MKKGGMEIKTRLKKEKENKKKQLSDTTGTFYPLKSSELMILCLNEHFSHFSVKAWATSLTSRDEEHACFTFKFERSADNSGINAGIKVPVCARLSCKHVCSL